VFPQYGKINEQGVFDFIGKNKLDFETIVSQFEIPGLDFADMAAKFDNMKFEADLPDADPVGKMQSSSASVKQVQLFFEVDQYDEFMSKVSDLEAVYKTENVTDTVMGAVRAAHKIKKTITR
jgi:hypothetical protein